MKAAAVVLSVLTLNAGGPNRIQQGWQSRREALISALKAENADAAAFQELWRDEDAGALAAAAGHAYGAYEPALGLAVTSRNRIVDRAALDLGDGCGVLRAGVEVGGATADVYSARLTPETGAASARRLGQLVATAEFVRSQSKTRTFVLLGDLEISSDDKEARIFLDLVGARDLCVSHGDEMCGRTFEDRRVDFALIPYSSRPPRETARAAFTEIARDQGETAPPHFGLSARLDGAWLKLRAAAEPDGRDEALAAAAGLLDAAQADAESRARRAGWLPWLGTLRALRAGNEAGALAADAERARSALARAAKPAPPAYE